MTEVESEAGARARGGAHTAAIDRAPPRLLPLVRHFSYRLTPALLPLPVTPNQITVAGTLVGLVGVCVLSRPGVLTGVIGCALFILCQVLDNCDGEVARLKNLRSPLGKRLDDCGDFLVHSTLFLALGARASAIYGGGVWAWLGAATAFGVAMEYTIELARSAASRDAALAPPPADRAARGTTVAGVAPAPIDATGTLSPFDDPGASGMDKLVYVFRVLFDADFCIILPLFVLGDFLWLLLPAGAIGNQVFWAMAFYEGARRYHA
jgi:phosphatidylglycerophosphate synthase